MKLPDLFYLQNILKYGSLVKFSHTLFAMPFAITGFFMAIRAGYPFQWKILLLVLLCMVFARNAAMAFNRWADRLIDASNQRTKNREIPSGVISSRHAITFTLINSFFFIVTTWFINFICFVLSPVALLVILGYSYTKRWGAWCHFVLGLGLSLAPVGAYLAVAGKFDILPVVLSFLVLTWVSGFDIIYALQDEAFDRISGLYSIPSVTGIQSAINISAILHFITIVLTVATGMIGRFGIFYFIGGFIFCILLVYQHLIIKPHDISKVNLAFFTLNGIASVLFAIFAVLDIFFAQFVTLLN